MQFIRPRFPASSRMFEYFEENSLSWPDLCMECPNGAQWCPWVDMQTNGPLHLAKTQLDDCQYDARTNLALCLLALGTVAGIAYGVCKATLPSGIPGFIACLASAGVTFWAAYRCYRMHSNALRKCLVDFSIELEARYIEVCETKP